jgi:hypothetical protein
MQAKKFILSVGPERLGPLDAGTVRAIEATTNLERLEQLALRLLHVSSWRELLATPASLTSEQQSSL